MVKLEEVMDEEFVREQEGPHDDDEWDTDSGTKRAKPLHLISMLPLPLPLSLPLFPPKQQQCSLKIPIFPSWKMKVI